MFSLFDYGKEEMRTLMNDLFFERMGVKREDIWETAQKWLHLERKLGVKREDIWETAQK